MMLWQDTIRFTPEHYSGQKNAPVYVVGITTGIGKVEFRRQAQQQGAILIKPEELRECLRDGIKRFVQENQQQELLNIIDAFETEPTEQNTAQIRDIERQVASVYPRYAKMLSDHDYYLGIAPFIATRIFLTGIENGIAYQSRDGRLTEECLYSISEEDIFAVGYKALSFFSISESQRKNSDSPLPSPSVPETTAAEN